MTAKSSYHMAYDVVKTIGGREYRYRVQSERDPNTGKTRNRWTYVGRVAGERTVPKGRVPRSDARLRLLAAAEQLLEGGEASAVTADAIAAAAGVAHGTFYRYFRDRSDALEALARHLRATRTENDDLLQGDVASRAAARTAMRAWVCERLDFVSKRRGTIRGWYALVASDARLAAYREERQNATLGRLGAYLTALAERGYICLPDPAATAAVLMSVLEGIVRTNILESDLLDAARIAAAADVVERAVFAQLE